MKKRKNLPTDSMVLTVESAVAQNLVIKAFKEAGIRIYSETQEFDPKYPYLCWDGYMLTQTKDHDDNRTKIKTVEEFLDLFIASAQETISIKLNSNYTAIVSADGVEVGCQTFPLSKIEELYKAVQEIKG